MTHHTDTPRSLNRLYTTCLVLICTIFPPLSMATPNLPSKNQALQNHIDLIEIALLTDAYNVRCRGISVAKSLSQVNRLYVTKYGLTANNFIKTYIDPNVKTLKIERQHRFNKLLNVLGGCRAAKSKEAIRGLKKHFKTLYETVETSPWYPE